MNPLSQSISVNDLLAQFLCVAEISKRAFYCGPSDPLLNSMLGTLDTDGARCFAGPVRTAKLRVDQHAGAGLQLSACEAGSCYAHHVTSS